MTGTDLCKNLATSVPVIFEPQCIYAASDSYRIKLRLKQFPNNTDWALLVRCH